MQQPVPLLQTKPGAHPPKHLLLISSFVQTQLFPGHPSARQKAFTYFIEENKNKITTERNRKNLKVLLLITFHIPLFHNKQSLSNFTITIKTFRFARQLNRHYLLSGNFRLVVKLNAQDCIEKKNSFQNLD